MASPRRRIDGFVRGPRNLGRGTRRRGGDVGAGAGAEAGAATWLLAAAPLACSRGCLAGLSSEIKRYK